jgi:hypothetical protein
MEQALGRADLEHAQAWAKDSEREFRDAAVVDDGLE